MSSRQKKDVKDNATDVTISSFKEFKQVLCQIAFGCLVCFTFGFGGFIIFGSISAASSVYLGSLLAENLHRVPLIFLGMYSVASIIAIQYSLLVHRKTYLLHWLLLTNNIVVNTSWFSRLFSADPKITLTIVSVLSIVNICGFYSIL